MGSSGGRDGLSCHGVGGTLEAKTGQSHPSFCPLTPQWFLCVSIPQPPGDTLPQTALTAHAMCPSSALPGDTYNSTVDTSFAEASPSISSSSGESPSVSPPPPMDWERDHSTRGCWGSRGE